jgi:uncharacterized protein YijF (DUF1287 family)
VTVHLVQFGKTLMIDRILQELEFSRGDVPVTRAIDEKRTIQILVEFEY